MTCKCGSERIMDLFGKCSDMCNVEVGHLDLEHTGYAPHIPNVCGGDDIHFSFCLDCGMIQNFKPASDELLQEEMYDENQSQKQLENEEIDYEYEMMSLQNSMVIRKYE